MQVTDRIKGLTVVLENNIRDDDCEYIIAAIKLIRGVISVKAHVADMDHYIAQETIRIELIKKLYDVLK